MKYLLDTCVISELVKKDPHKHVVQWIREKQEEDLFLSVLTIGEIHKGIEKLDQSSKKEKLFNWIEYDLKERFKNRIIEIDMRITEEWARIQVQAEKKGHPIPAVDSLIAATAKTHHLTIITRNTGDMKPSGADLYNPWR